MNARPDETSLCERVLDLLVEGDDLSGDQGDDRGDDRDDDRDDDLDDRGILAEHLRSCVTCFRALTELRDAPRMAEALRGEAPALPLPPHPDDRFWDDLATRTTAAAERALRETLQGAKTPEKTAPMSVGLPRHARSRRSSSARVGIISVAATLAAAAAGFMLVARGPLHSPSGIPATPATLVSAVRSRTMATADRSVARSVVNDAVTDEEADVAELDVGALHRLLDRLRPRAPAALTTPGLSGPADTADAPSDDEAGVNEELADLDADELRRVASSFGVGAL